MGQRTIAIEREALDGCHQFVLRVNGERLGFLEFTRPDQDVMQIEYVEVDPELRGSGLGRQLVEQAVGFAKANDWTVVPVCSYARAVIERDAALSASLR